jgi:hypothetical protein
MALLDFEILKAHGTTNERLRELFTAVPDPNLAPKKGETKEEKRARIERKRKNERDLQQRENIRQLLQARVEEGINHSLKNWRLWASVDAAWDSSVITRMTLPLQLYAQGKINVKRAAKLLSACNGGDKFIKKDDAGKPISIDVPRFVETNVNLIRSFVSRRHAAQKNKYNQLWPYYDFEARSTGLVAKCRADVLSQRVDMMVDQFDYRHHDSQVMRDGFLYAHSVDFVRSSWEVEKQLRRKSVEGPATDTEAVITKEGVGWINPHPSRVFWDNAYPLASINTDTGCEWVGFWDVVRFGEIDNNPHYFNKASVGWTGKYWGENGICNTYGDYFNHYQYAIAQPTPGDIDPSRANDRKAIQGCYSSNVLDASCFLTNFFWKVVPKDLGIGEYPWPVWLRLVTASDSTVIFAEIMPSTPAAYLGINENDSRKVNVSMAMDLFSAQDQMTNLMSQLMLVCQMELFKIVGLNTDLLSPEQIQSIRTRFNTGAWLEGPTVIEYSLAKLESLGIKPEKLIEFHQANQGATINSIFEAMIRLVETTEKLMAMSPAEQGQPAPREISATETNEIASTTSSVYSSISDDIDEYRAAKKRIVYESLVALGQGQIECPVKDRYTPKTIIAAGFQPKKDEDEDYTSTDIKGKKPRRQTVIGSKRALIHDYIFTTRDGGERAVNTQAANTLVQLIGQVLAVPMVAQAMGKEKLYEMFNEVFRMSGAGVDLILTLKEGEDDSLGQDEIAAMKQTLEQVTQFLNQMGTQLQKNAEEIASQEQVNQQQQQAIQLNAQLAEKVRTMAEQMQELRDGPGKAVVRLIETLKYSDAPESIKRQIEAQKTTK